MSWISEEEELLKIQDDCEKEYLNEIQCFFIYVNANSYIEKITSKTIDLEYNEDDDNTTILKEDICNIIEEEKKSNKNENYIIEDCWEINIDLEPEDIKEFSKEQNLETCYNSFFKKISYKDDIVIEPSIFIFHKINALYFLFKKEEKPITVKPILKLRSPNEKSKKSDITKKVTIKLKKKDTRKNIF